MFCPNCGSQVKEGAAFCTECGSPLGSTAEFQSPPEYSPAPVYPPQSGYQQQSYQPDSYQQQSYQPDSYQQQGYQPGYPGYQQQGYQPGYPGYQQQASQYPMKWYNFLVKFLLYAGMVLNGISGVLSIIGGSFISGAAYICMGVVAYYVRKELARFGSSGPTYYYGYMAANSVLTLISSLVAGQSFGYIIGNIIGSGLVIYLNYIYFNKRKSLFTH